MRTETGLKQFVVSVVSTKLDMSDLREELKARLASLGFEVRAYDEATYPYGTRATQAAQTVGLATEWDLVIVTVDKRYGTEWEGEQSVTESEWERATASGDAVVITCVRDGTWSEFKNWSRQAAGQNWNPTYVEDVRVLQFVERISEKEHPLVFQHVTDYLSAIESKIRSLTPLFLWMLSRESHRHMRRRRTVTELDTLLSLGDVFDHGLYVSPPYEVQSGTLDGDVLEQAITKSVASGGKLILSGIAGAGKSTSIAKAFDVRFGHQQSSTPVSLAIPIYVDCRQLTCEAIRDLGTLIARLFEVYLKKQPWPVLSPSDTNVRLELFIDGLDEVIGAVTEVTEAVIGSSIWASVANVVAFRMDFYSRVFGDAQIAGIYDGVVKLNPWDLGSIGTYLRQRFVDSEVPDKLMQHLESSVSLKSLASSPVGLVMISSLDDVENITDHANLYQRFIQHWARREAHRHQECVDVNATIGAWRELSWAHQTGRLKPETPVSRLCTMFPEFDVRRQLVDTPVVKSLFNIRVGFEGEEVFLGFVHDSVEEYLAAVELVAKLRGSDYTATEALECDTKCEINEFAQLLLKKWEQPVADETLHRLKALYVSRRSDSGPRGQLLRNKVCFYVGRLGRINPSIGAKSVSFLEHAWRHETEAFVRQAIGFALAITGESESAIAFVNEMREKQELDRSNRGYHLVYYGDQRGTEPPYVDPECGSWAETRRALDKRLNDNERPRRHSRVVDLFTLHRFLLTRNEATNADEHQAIREIRDQLTAYSEVEQDKLRELCDTVEQSSGV